MNQQALAQELTALINAGLKQRTVPIDRPTWVLGYTDIDGWVVSHQAQPNPRFPQGVPLGFDQLIVFRELSEIEPILDRLPPLRLAAPLRAAPEETLFSAQGESEFLHHTFDTIVKAEGLIAFSEAEGQTNADPQKVKQAIVSLRELLTNIAARMGENRKRFNR